MRWRVWYFKDHPGSARKNRFDTYNYSELTEDGLHRLNNEVAYQMSPFRWELISLVWKDKDYDCV